MSDITYNTRTTPCSHGATFFCPHTYDVKILATIVEDDARATLCESFYKHKQTFPIHAFRPTLPAGGLPDEAQGRLSGWTSPVLYHVFNFGKDNNAGPGAGWNLTTIRNATSTIKIKQVWDLLILLFFLGISHSRCCYEI